MLPALPGIGATVNGARLWVRVGSFQFQPGELAKIFLIVFLAGYLREKREVLAQGRIKDFGPLLVIWGAAMLVLVETKDLGSALLFFGIFLAMVYMATGRALVVGRRARAVRRRRRVRLPRRAARAGARRRSGATRGGRARTAGYQSAQALYSIANGGFGGTGFGKGTFTNPGGDQLIPELNTDFIYSALAQELGLSAPSALILVYMLFVLRGMRVALLADDGFSKLLAAASRSASRCRRSSSSAASCGSCR